MDALGAAVTGGPQRSREPGSRADLERSPHVSRRLRLCGTEDGVLLQFRGHESPATSRRRSSTGPATGSGRGTFRLRYRRHPEIEVGIDHRTVTVGGTAGRATASPVRVRGEEFRPDPRSTLEIPLRRRRSD